MRNTCTATSGETVKGFQTKIQGNGIVDLHCASAKRSRWFTKPRDCTHRQSRTFCFARLQERDAQGIVLSTSTNDAGYASEAGSSNSVSVSSSDVVLSLLYLTAPSQSALMRKDPPLNDYIQTSLMLQYNHR